MKIAIDARIINSTTGRYIERLLHHLEELDKTNDYLVLVPKKDLHYYKPRNKRFRIVEANSDNYSLNEQIGFLRLLNKLKPDLVHFCMPQQPILYQGLHVTTVHDLNLLNTYNSDKNYLVYKFKQGIGRLAFYIIGHTSAHIITPTHYTKDAYTAFANINPQKITVTYEASETAKISPKPYEPLVDKQFLLYVGQQSDYKNIRRLMQAHRQLRKKYPELLLALAGRLSGKNGKPLQMNREWATKHGFEGVIYTDFVTDEQLRWLYKHCATYVFPSLMEGFGLPGLEAMSAGASVVSSNATCLPEVYGNAAHYFDPLSVDDMAQKIDDVLQDKPLQKKLIERGAKQAAKYSWRTMAEQTLAVYQKVLKNT
jgi:glycosyltransferase involved in cell wall biosynthesis